MSIDLTELNKHLIPIKGFDDLLKRWQESFSYPFVSRIFNYSIPELNQYVLASVGADPKNRYERYTSTLVDILGKFHTIGIKDVLDLKLQIEVRPLLEMLLSKSQASLPEFAALLKFLTYWFIPTAKYMSGLIQNDPIHLAAVRTLSGYGLKSNLDYLQRGLTAELRKNLAVETGLPVEEVTNLVHRADLSRMPWASKATLNNLVGAGYGSLALLANADPAACSEAFYKYGRSIGKNFKFGNEIENTQRIAYILPVILEE